MSRSIFLLASIILFTGLSAQQTRFTETDPEIGVVERLNETVPDDIQVINEQGDTVFLKSLIDKPTVVNFVYYRCPGICSPLMDGIADMIEKSDLVPGTDYQVLTISFDSREGTELAVKKKFNYTHQVKSKDLDSAWYFFTTDSLNAIKATSAFGFRYKPQGNDFLHSATIILVSPEGKITRYLNGTYFLPFEFKLAVIEASKGIPGPTINRILQFCYSYDPSGQQYVLNVTKVSGIIILFIALSIFLFLLLKPVFRKKTSLINQ